MANFIQRNIVNPTLNVLKRNGFLPTNFGTPYMNMFAGVGMQNKSNVIVNAETANKLSAFYSCVRNISEDIAKLPTKIQRIDKNGNKIDLLNHPAYRLLNISPNGMSNPMTFIETIIDRALRKGDGFAYIKRDENATPTALIFLEYETVIPFFGDDFLMYYKVHDPIMKINGIYPSQDIFHFRGMGNQFRGMSVLRYASESIGAAIATQDYRGKFYGTGANMTGILKTTADSKDENVMIARKQSFQRSYQQDGIAMMGPGTEFQKLNFNADESQMLGASEFNVKDIARWFRMPLSKLQTSDNISNIEALSIEYVTDCLTPWIVRFEQEVQTKLFTEAEKTNTICYIDTFSLLRGDSAAEERRIKTLYYTGAICPDEIRHQVGLNSRVDGGTYFNPVNMIPDEYLQSFWQSKDNSQANQGAGDNTGSGQGAMNQKSKRELVKQLIELAKITQEIEVDGN
jgi:HK97 family phage portal protein